jgi:hypothetical protein
LGNRSAAKGVQSRSTKNKGELHTVLKRIFFLLLLITGLSGWTTAQGLSQSSPTTDNSASAGAKERTSLTEQLDVPVVEPLAKRFRMNIPFGIGAYKEASPENALVHQYIWDTFSEGFIMLQYTEYPAGTIPASADARRQWVSDHAVASFEKLGIETKSEKEVKFGTISGKQYEAIFRGHKAIIRVFANGDEYYALTALPVPEHAGPTIEKLFNSFEFVKP